MLNDCLLGASIRIISVILATYHPHILFDVSVTPREPVPDVIIRSELAR